jgi:hypothetical protein
MGNDIAKQNQSVVGRHPFDVIDDNNLNLRFVRLELQPQLLLHGRKKIGRRKLWSFTCRLRGQRRVADEIDCSARSSQSYRERAGQLPR